MLLGFERNALNRFLESLEYPIGKERLIETAKEREIPLTVTALLMSLPDGHEFSSAEEVNHELTAMTRG